jgi:hypothetical protein
MENKDFVPQLKVRTNLKGGQGGGYVNGVYYPDQSGVCGTSTTPPTSGGGYVNGVYYPDKSGVCGGTAPSTTTSPTTTGGGYVNGVWYPDKSGVC